MKRMELKIAFTFAIMFVVSFIIYGIRNVIDAGVSFFTFEVAANALIDALVFLSFIWLHTRRHKILAYIGFWAGCFVIIFISFSSEGVTGIFSDLDALTFVKCFYYTIAFAIAEYQGEKLLEEDEET